MIKKHKTKQKTSENINDAIEPGNVLLTFFNLIQ